MSEKQYIVKMLIPFMDDGLLNKISPELVDAIDSLVRSSYQDGMENGWKLANNEVKDALRPWLKGVHNIKLPNYIKEGKEE